MKKIFSIFFVCFALVFSSSAFANKIGVVYDSGGKFDKSFNELAFKTATYEFMYKPNLSINIIIKEYLNSSNFFLEDSQTKYLNALLDNVGKKLRSNNAWIWSNK